MKVLVCYNDHPNGNYHKTVRITLPKNWKTKSSVNDLLQQFLKPYNSHFARINPLKEQDVYLALPLATQQRSRNSTSPRYIALHPQATISSCITDRSTVYIRHLRHHQPAATTSADPTMTTAMNTKDDHPRHDVPADPWTIPEFDKERNHHGATKATTPPSKSVTTSPTATSAAAASAPHSRKSAFVNGFVKRAKSEGDYLSLNSNEEEEYDEAEEDGDVVVKVEEERRADDRDRDHNEVRGQHEKRDGIAVDDNKNHGPSSSLPIAMFVMEDGNHNNNNQYRNDKQEPEDDNNSGGSMVINQTGIQRYQKKMGKASASSSSSSSMPSFSFFGKSSSSNQQPKPNDHDRPTSTMLPTTVAEEEAPKKSQDHDDEEDHSSISIKEANSPKNGSSQYETIMCETSSSHHAIIAEPEDDDNDDDVDDDVMAAVNAADDATSSKSSSSSLFHIPPFHKLMTRKQQSSSSSSPPPPSSQHHHDVESNHAPMSSSSHHDVSSVRESPAMTTMTTSTTNPNHDDDDDKPMATTESGKMMMTMIMTDTAATSINPSGITDENSYDGSDGMSDDNNGKQQHQQEQQSQEPEPENHVTNHTDTSGMITNNNSNMVMTEQQQEQQQHLLQQQGHHSSDSMCEITVTEMDNIEVKSVDAPDQPPATSSAASNVPMLAGRVANENIAVTVPTPQSYAATTSITRREASPGTTRSEATNAASTIIDDETVKISNSPASSMMTKAPRRTILKKSVRTPSASSTTTNATASDSATTPTSNKRNQNNDNNNNKRNTKSILAALFKKKGTKQMETITEEPSPHSVTHKNIDVDHAKMDAGAAVAIDDQNKGKEAPTAIKTNVTFTGTIGSFEEYYYYDELRKLKLALDESGVIIDPILFDQVISDMKKEVHRLNHTNDDNIEHTLSFQARENDVKIKNQLVGMLQASITAVLASYHHQATNSLDSNRSANSSKLDKSLIMMSPPNAAGTITSPVLNHPPGSTANRSVVINESFKELKQQQTQRDDSSNALQRYHPLHIRTLLDTPRSLFDASTRDWTAATTPHLPDQLTAMCGTFFGNHETKDDDYTIDDIRGSGTEDTYSTYPDKDNHNHHTHEANGGGGGASIIISPTHSLKKDTPSQGNDEKKKDDSEQQQIGFFQAFANEVYFARYYGCRDEDSCHCAQALALD